MKNLEQFEPLKEITVWQSLEETARRFPDVDALVCPFEGVRYTYAGMKAKVARLARGLYAMGVRKGDHVAIFATNVPEWILLMYATARIGAVLVTVNTNYKRFELEYLLEQSDSTTLFLIGGFKDFEYVSYLKEICPEISGSTPGQLKAEALPFLRNIVFIGAKDRTPEGMFHFDDLDDLAEQTREETIEQIAQSQDIHDVINMQYTSGTTGFPKGVMLTHYNIVNNGKCIGDCMNFSEKDRLLITVPLFHCFGMVLAVTASVTHGTSMVVIERFNPLRVMQAIEQEKCTAFHGVPTMFISVLEHPDFSKYNFSTLRTGIMAGSPCPKKVMEKVVSEMHMSEVVITYGLTESSPGITMSRTDDPVDLRVATVGRRLPHCEAKIVNPETGETCPPNVPGEIMTRGYHIMKGYYKMPEATALAIEKDGWLHTGDIGTEDENGYYKVTGRLKDMIIRGGENIYPKEIEEYLYTNPKVRDVQVVGIPDVKYGEEVLAYIILQEGAEATESEMIDFVKKGLSSYKCPRRVLFIKEFPLTGSGKIQKYKLREMAVDLLGLHSAAAIETA